METVDENQVFACWLQKKSGDYGLFERAVFGSGRLRPRSPVIPGPASAILEVTMVVCAEDAVTPLGGSLVTLTAGKAYSLVLKSGK